jgi:hypothetical protein
MRFIPLVPLLLAPALAHAAGVQSAYTKIDNSDCKLVSEYKAGATSYCKGYDGIWLRVDDGDSRVSVTYGIDPDEPAETDRKFESFTSFNSVNDVVEWRFRDDVNDGRPYAAILRWLVSVRRDSGSDIEWNTGQVLVVSRVADDDSPGCVVGYVDALVNPDANGMAREIADTMAADFQCGVDEPAYHGETGRLSGQPMRAW